MQSQELWGSRRIKLNCICICVPYPDPAPQKEGIALGQGWMEPLREFKTLEWQLRKLRETSTWEIKVWR